VIFRWYISRLSCSRSGLIIGRHAFKDFVFHNYYFIFIVIFIKASHQNQTYPPYYQIEPYYYQKLKTQVALRDDIKVKRIHHAIKSNRSTIKCEKPGLGRFNHFTYCTYYYSQWCVVYLYPFYSVTLTVLTIGNPVTAPDPLMQCFINLDFRIYITWTT
jgi:hypothetical protein